MLHSTPLSELREISKDSSIFDRSAYFALCERNFTKQSNELRAKLDDGFVSEFSNYLKELEIKFEFESDTIRRTRSVEESIRAELTRMGLSVLAKKGSSGDIRFFRQILGAGSIPTRKEDFEFIGKHGAWQDVVLIGTSLKNAVPANRTLLSSSPDKKIVRIAARAILRLAKGRMAEVFDLELPDDLRSQIVELMPGAAFAGISDDKLLSLLHSQDDEFRKCAARKCVLALSKARMGKLLEKYHLADKQHYYNVIHWLAQFSF